MNVLESIKNKFSGKKTTDLRDEVYKQEKAKTELELARLRARRDAGLAYKRETEALRSGGGGVGSKLAGGFDWAKKNLFTQNMGGALGYGSGKRRGGGGGFGGGMGGNLMGGLGYSQSRPVRHHKVRKHARSRSRGRERIIVVRA